MMLVVLLPSSGGDLVGVEPVVPFTRVTQVGDLPPSHPVLVVFTGVSVLNFWAAVLFEVGVEGSWAAVFCQIEVECTWPAVLF